MSAPWYAESHVVQVSAAEHTSQLASLQVAAATTLSPSKEYPASVTNVHGVFVVIPAVGLHVLAVLVAQCAWSTHVTTLSPTNTYPGSVTDVHVVFVVIPAVVLHVLGVLAPQFT